MKIYKYPLMGIRSLLHDQATRVILKVPHGAVLLPRTKLQNGIIVQYAAINEHEQQQDAFEFVIIGTGYTMPNDIIETEYLYDNSHVADEVGLVAHVFRKRDMVNPSDRNVNV